eukprot:c23387_g1_i1 orf=434-640(-)
MAPRLYTLALLGVTSLLLLGYSSQVDAVVSCGSVTASLVPCINYLQSGTPVPAPNSACCNNVRGLNTR